MKLCTGAPSSVIFVAALRSARSDRCAFATAEARFWRAACFVVVIEEQWGEGATHVPFDIEGEHAEKDVGPDSFGKPDRWAHLEIDCLEASEGTFDLSEALVGEDGVFRGDLLPEACANDVQAVEGGFGFDIRAPVGGDSSKSLQGRPMRSPTFAI